RTSRPGTPGHPGKRRERQPVLSRPRRGSPRPTRAAGGISPGVSADTGERYVCLQPLRLSPGSRNASATALPAMQQSLLVEGPGDSAYQVNRRTRARSVKEAATRALARSSFSFRERHQEHAMLGDYSSINDHLDTARKHADQAETEAKPALYREAVDELVAA